LQARFIEDITIPDGCVVNPSAKLLKSWKLENSGDEAWPAGCFMVIQDGNPALGVETSEITLPALQPGEQFVAEVNVVAPSVPGRYTSYWRVCDPSGIRFGHRFWMDIIVANDDDEIIPHATPFVSLGAEDNTSVPGAMCCNVEIVDVTADKDDDDSKSESGSDSSSSSDSSESDSESVSESEKASSEDDNEDDDIEIVAAHIADCTVTPFLYPNALETLASMGFTDEEKNRRHLEATGGDITTAVASLLAE